MKSNRETALEDAIKNAERYIEQMVSMDDKKLSKHLDSFRQQMEMANKQNNKKAVELLCEYERQTIIARVIKNELLQKKKKQNRL